MDHADPVGPGVGRVAVEASPLHVVGGAALAGAVLRDDAGRVLARGQGHFTTLQGPPAEWPGVVDADPVEDRYARLRAALDLPPAGDPADRSVPLPPALANTRGAIHGGTAMAIAHLAQLDLRLAHSGPEGRPRLLSIHVEYLRPVDCDGALPGCRSRYERRGRRYSTLRTELTGPGGKLVAIASGLWSANS